MGKLYKLVIDIHNHVFRQPKFEERLLKYMDEAGVDIVCLSPSLEFFEPPFKDPNNKVVEELMKKYPDRIIGFGAVYPGRMPYDLIDELHAKEFRGIKMTIPTKPYDHDDFMKYYEKAEDYGMPILFHTGVVARFKYDHLANVSSDRMRPAHLDRIARTFPKLKIIAAHMGDPWYLEAYMTAQKHPNMWMDVSGLARVTKVIAIKTYLGIRLTPDKLLFGLDEPPEEYPRLVWFWDTALREIGISEEDRRKIFGETAAKILGIKF